MTDLMKKLKGADSYDWREVFGYVGEPGTSAYGRVSISPVMGEDPPASVDPFGLADVAEVVAMSEGENDGPDWLVVVKLTDGRYAFVSAGCDYTGWDCQAGGRGMVSMSKSRLIRYGIGVGERSRLGLGVSGDPDVTMTVSR